MPGVRAGGEAMSGQSEWVSWITNRGIYGYTHRAVEWDDGVPIKTACGRVPGPRYRETSAGLRCLKCRAISKARGQ